jgi:hypothetical protein
VKYHLTVSNDLKPAKPLRVGAVPQLKIDMSVQKDSSRSGGGRGPTKSPPQPIRYLDSTDRSNQLGSNSHVFEQRYNLLTEKRSLSRKKRHINPIEKRIQQYLDKV